MIDKNGNAVEIEDESDFWEDDESSVSERVLDSIVEAFQNGANPEWLILKGDKASKAAANAWIKSQKRIEGRRLAAEKARRKAELRQQGLAKLSQEEREALGIKG